MTKEEERIQLQEENRVLRETVEQQRELIEQLQTQLLSLGEQVKSLQERLAKDSHNSHLPPSSDRFGRKAKSLRKTSEKKSGGQPGHPGATLQWTSTPDEVTLCEVVQCEGCQQDLRTVQVCGRERRQVVDVPPTRVFVREYQAEQKRCPQCQHLTVASFPQEASAPLHYGTRIGAIAVYLTQQQLLPLARACEVMSDLLGLQMSEGTVGELIQRCSRQLAPVEDKITAALTQAEVIHQDETGLVVAGKRHWMHVTCTPTLTHYHVHASRGHPALEAIGILPQFTGISIHDGWGSYFLYDCDHAVCLVHVLRELVALEEQGHPWASDLKDLLLEMKAATEEARALGQRRLDPHEVMDWEAQFLRLLEEGDQACPRATSPPGKRGRCKQSDARNLLDRLRKQQKAVLTFLEDLRVDFDNNLAERDLRMVKVQQKVSGCFRSMAGAHAFARIRGYVSTLRKQGLPLLSALQATLAGHPVLPSL